MNLETIQGLKYNRKPASLQFYFFVAFRNKPIINFEFRVLLFSQIIFYAVENVLWQGTEIATTQSLFFTTDSSVGLNIFLTFHHHRQSHVHGRMSFATYVYIIVVLVVVGLLSGVVCGEQDNHVNKDGPTG
jgi:uncharacterized membrane protein YbjE (DUF340 family)